VLDIGCGPGLQTVDLAELLPEARITAIDAHAPYLEQLERLAGERGLAGRIDARPGNLFDLGFPAHCFDLVWCEGAAYILGFGEAVSAWVRLLAPGGRLVISEPVALEAELPDRVEAFWKSAYPPMTDVAGCRERAVQAGAEVLGDFVLPDAAWFDHYYGPMEARITKLRGRYRGDALAEAVLNDCQEEIDLYRSAGHAYGYAMFVMARASGRE
jgi:SAM-dependent methyltransferase